LQAKAQGVADVWGDNSDLAWWHTFFFDKTGDLIDNPAQHLWIESKWAFRHSEGMLLIFAGDDIWDCLNGLIASTCCPLDA
jgi:hypothetical protein